MKRCCAALAIALSFIVPLSVVAQDSATKQFAARTELYSIPSLTLSDEQFLKGDAGGKSVLVSGQLRIAQGSGRPRCGLDSRIKRHGAEHRFLDEGI